MNPTRHSIALDQEFLDRAEQIFRALLWRVGCRPLNASVQERVEQVLRGREQGRPAKEALHEVYRRARRQVIEQLAERGRRRARLLETTIAPLPPELGVDFHCDAGLGGLARWLRAAGYDAAFWPGIDDDLLLRKLPGTSAVLLTSDRRLMERGVIDSGAIAALLVPNSLKKREQFWFVRDELDLPLKSTRCMACGGRLLPVDKEVLRDRIPPRTFPWLDDYYLCQRCDRLFWHGTHWQRIGAALHSAEKG